MVPISSAHLEFRLSGGAANTDPNASLGGVMSSEKIQSQSASGITNVTGVTVLFAAGHLEGIGTLTYVDATSSLRWTPPAGAIGPAVAVTEDGRYSLFGASDIGWLVVDVDFSALPATDQSDAVTIANVLQELFDPISSDDSFDGSIEYRCYYILNVHPTDSFIEATLFMGSQPVPGTIAFGKDPAGIGNGVTTGVATTVANEDTAPAGVTFSTAASESAGQNVGQLDAGKAQAVWLRRTLAARNTVANPESSALTNVQVYFST